MQTELNIKRVQNLSTTNHKKITKPLKEHCGSIILKIELICETNNQVCENELRVRGRLGSEIGCQKKKSDITLRAETYHTYLCKCK